MSVLYRGITLNPETASADREAIRQTGQLAVNSFWKNTMAGPAEVRALSAELAREPCSIREAIERLPQTPLTYACGDFDGAAHYALNVDGTPAVIAFEIALEEVIIDGKDFLYTVFHLWDRGGGDHRRRVRENLSTLFGPAMVRWFDRACGETDTKARLGLCDLAVHDLAAIKRHYANRTVIAGRSHRLFRSAFALPAKLDPAAILDIHDIARPPPVPTRTIHFHADMLIP